MEIELNFRPTQSGAALNPVALSRDSNPFPDNAETSIDQQKRSALNSLNSTQHFNDKSE